MLFFLLLVLLLVGTAFVYVVVCLMAEIVKWLNEES